MCSEFVVQVKTTVGRSVSRDFEVFHQFAFLVGIDIFHKLVESLHGVRLQLAGTQIGLLDEEHDVGTLGLLDDTLESIFSISGVGVGQCVLHQLGSCNHAVSHLHSRDGHFLSLLAHFGVKLQVELRLGHFRDVVERSRHRVVATSLVVNGLVVALHFLSLESHGFAFDLTAFPTEHGSDGHYCFFLKILFRKFTVDCYINFSSDGLKDLGSRREIIG